MASLRSVIKTTTPRLGFSRSRRFYSLPSSSPTKQDVRIVEVGPRDGLQNEKAAIIPVEVKVELIDRLTRAGVMTVEAGSFVSPKWVPQMADTAEVLKRMTRHPGVHYPVLVPNQRGLDDLLALLDVHPGLTDEVAVFTAASDGFARANLNCTVAESLERLEGVVRVARERGLRVRGYVSVVIECPYSGRTDYGKVREVARALVDMGCYEVSLGETMGKGRPHQVAEMIEEVKKGVPVHLLAGHVSRFGLYSLLSFNNCFPSSMIHTAQVSPMC